eukprot:gene13668-4571_t
MDAVFGERPISLRALADFSQLDQQTRSHLKNVYAALTLSTFLAAGGAGVHIFTDVLKGGFLSGIVGIGLMLALAFTSNEPKNQMKRMAGGAGVHIFTDVLKGGFLSGIVGIGLMLALAFTSNEPKNQMKRMGYLGGFAFCTGLGLGPLMDAVIEIDRSIIPTAFLATCLIFACFSLSALWAKERSYLYLGDPTLWWLDPFLCLHPLRHTADYPEEKEWGQ